MRIFEATCAAKIVLVNGNPVVNCPILGEGGNSSGYLVISESDLFYIPKITPDVKSFLALAEKLCEKLETLCDTIKAITVTCSVPGSPSGVPINSAAFDSAKTNIATIHTDLTTLKVALK